MVALLFYFISFYDTHQVIAGLPQGGNVLCWWLSYFILFYFILDYIYSFLFNLIFITRTRCLQGSPKGMVALFFYLFCFVLFLFHFGLFL
jgi:hypothetical protein